MKLISEHPKPTPRHPQYYTVKLSKEEMCVILALHGYVGGVGYRKRNNTVAPRGVFDRIAIDISRALWPEDEMNVAQYRRAATILKATLKGAVSIDPEDDWQ